ncbi:MAG: hypothetical protein BWY51_00110 [Parcubacteria group bacterium ADurb.Bin316]|nr:MAG: hypothetical protein BWY51_00110 [Parcubacteria group bacterium ADurb.Bin316]HOZ56229.1 hypothetical protein [bacterium]
MLTLNQRSKLFFYPILYWIIFIFFPIVIAYIYQDNSSIINFSGILMFFVIFVAPFLYFIPYKTIIFENKKQKILFVFLGLMLPYLFLLAFLSYKIANNFSRSNFPF